MNKSIILSKEFLDKLTDDEIYLLINIFPKERLLEPIKKNPKKFKNETRGYRIDIKSKMLIDKLPNIYFDRIRKHDAYIINIINRDINVAINAVNNHIFETTSDKEFLEKSILSNNIEDFAKLIDLILEDLKPEYIKLFFKLIGKELSEEQNNCIDTQIKMIIIKNQLTEKISKELETKCRKQIIDIENVHKTEIFNQLEKIKEIKKELNAIKLKLSEEKKHSNFLCDEIERIKSEKNEEVNILQDFINKLNLQNTIMKNELLEFKNAIEEKDFIIEKLNNDLNLKYNEYSINAQERWNFENENLLNIQNNLRKECGDLEKIKLKLNNDIRKLENEKLHLDDKILGLENTVNNFITNIDERIIEKALYDSILKINSKNSMLEGNKEYNYSNLYIKINKKEANISKCNNINDFAENIATNLENIGVKDIADEVANYVIGILAANMTPLICGYKAREIATAISISYSGETPYIISLPNGYTNSKELIEIYNSAESNVVLIEDAIGTMNENALMPLLREKSQNGFSTKILLISTENVDSIKYMPLNLYNQVALVMINKYGTGKNADYEISDARKVLEKFVTQTQVDNEHKLIKKITNNLKFSGAYEIIRSTIVAYSNELSNSKLSLQGYLRSELMYICKCNNMIADLEDNIQKYQLGDNLAEIVRCDLYG